MESLNYRTSLFTSCDHWSHLSSLTSLLNVLSFLPSAPTASVYCCSPNTPGLLLTQGLCTGCFFCPEHIDPGHAHVSLPYFFQISPRCYLSESLWPHCLILPHTFGASCPLFLFILHHITYYINILYIILCLLSALAPRMYKLSEGMNFFWFTLVS